MNPAWLILPVSAAALYIAVRESRRNGSVVVQLLKSSTAYHMHVSGEQRTKYELELRNLGIPLHSPTVEISFKYIAEDRVPTRMNVKLGPEAVGLELSKGMIGRFNLELYEPDDRRRIAVSRMGCPFEQRAHLVIRSQGHIVKTICAFGPLERLRRQWNRLLYRLFKYETASRLTVKSLSWEFEKLAKAGTRQS